MGLIRRDLPAPPAWPPPGDPNHIFDLVRYVSNRDPLGHRVHIALAGLYALMLPIAPALEAISFLLLVGYALIRLPNTWRCYTPLFRNRLIQAGLLWMVIQGISIAWSVTPGEGWEELKAFRAALLIPAMWPVLAFVPWYFTAFLCGLFVTNSLQVLQELHWVAIKPDEENRARALLHPIQTGAFALAGVTCYLGALLRVPTLSTRRRAFIFGAVCLGGVTALFGLVASGSRGPWLAAIVVLPMMFIVVMCRRHVSRRTGWLALLGVAVLAGTLGLTHGSYIRDRVVRGWDEFTKAEEEGYATGVGQRLVMAKWGWQFFTESPVWGRGAGSFRELTRQTPEYQRILDDNPAMKRRIERGEITDGRITAAHPHSAYLHVLYSTGALGFIPFAALLVLAIRQSICDRRDHLFADAPLFILIGWMIGTLFDCYTLNGHLAGLFAFIVTTTIAYRAPVSATLLSLSSDERSDDGTE